ncbi:MAG TPA: hypothetical protein V6C58_09215, partial [Allocoleopsis sp.]
HFNDFYHNYPELAITLYFIPYYIFVYSIMDVGCFYLSRRPYSIRHDIVYAYYDRYRQRQYWKRISL